VIPGLRCRGSGIRGAIPLSRACGGPLMVPTGTQNQTPGTILQNVNRRMLMFINRPIVTKLASSDEPP